MKRFKHLVIALVAIVAFAAPQAQAQFRWGIKAGVNINSLHFSKDGAKSDLLSSDNRAGFTGGLMAEFSIPVVGICFDASVMYTHRVNYMKGEGDASNFKTFNNDFVEIPINLKYRFSLPGVGKLVAPYLYTGPSFAVKASKDAVKDITEKKCDINWNVGLGLQFFNHVQLSAGYGFGINKAMNIAGVGTTPIEARSNCWTVTAAYLF